jgi:hypothetical protein
VVLFIAFIVAVVALYVAARIGTALGRKAPAFISSILAAGAAIAAFYWLFIWRLSVYEGAASGVAIFWVFAKAFGVVCLVAAGALVFGTATHGNQRPDA